MAPRAIMTPAAPVSVMKRRAASAEEMSPDPKTGTQRAWDRAAMAVQSALAGIALGPRPRMEGDGRGPGLDGDAGSLEIVDGGGVPTEAYLHGDGDALGSEDLRHGRDDLSDEFGPAHEGRARPRLDDLGDGAAAQLRSTMRGL